MTAQAGNAKIVTGRSFAIGLAVTGVVNFWITYFEYIAHASRMNLSQFPPPADTRPRFQ